ncbi:ABC transporter substrate binding protein [Desulfococcaceae bacterium HSG8]|nr:ABC transporter substrate binding protein [Desulfococcaceae bacterium HSG8]
MKRFIIMGWVAFLLLFAWGTAQVSAGQKVRIGVLHRLGEHPDHIALRKGFLKGMKEKGYDVELTVFNVDVAKYRDTYAKRGIDEAKRMEKAGVEMIFCTGMYYIIKDAGINIPIIDSIFLSPINWKYAVMKEGKMYCTGNATGTIFGYSFKDIADFIQSVLPKAKKLAYINNPESPVSRPISELEKEAKRVGLEVTDCPFSAKDKAIDAIKKAVQDTDVAFSTNDLATMRVEEKVLKFAVDKKFPVVGGCLPFIKYGAVAGIQCNWFRSGEICADKADKILKGRQANTIPIGSSDKADIAINLKEAKKMGIEVPYEWIEIATEVVE